MEPMKLTKKSHACVRLEKDGRTLVIDPGGFSEEDAAVGADAILVTHEHPDHFDEERLRAALEANPAAEIWTLRSRRRDRSPPPSPAGCTPSATATPSPPPGFDVQVHGELHAVIHPDIPRITNVGYLVDGGRSSTPATPSPSPTTPVETLLLPVMAPWSKISEVIDYVREVKPRRAYRHPRRPAHRPRPPDLRPADRRPGRRGPPAAGAGRRRPTV